MVFSINYYANLLSSYLIILFLLQYANSYCVMQEECQKHPESAISPCALGPDEGKPLKMKKLEHPVEFEKLAQYCPSLVNSDKFAEVCCTPSQINGLIGLLSQAQQVVGRCPSCFHNFAQIWCQFTCSPKQSKFMKVVETRKGNLKRSNSSLPSNYVWSVDYNISRKFVEQAFDSCKDVEFGNKKALRLFSYDPSNITLDGWLKFMGTQNMKLMVPVSTKFRVGEEKDNHLQMNLPVAKCHQPLSPNQAACSKSDCKTQEEMPEFLDFNKFPQISTLVLDFDVPSLEWLLKIFYCCIFTSVVVLVLKFYCHRQKEPKSSNVGCCVDTIGPIEMLFEDTCNWYAKTVIQYPWRCAIIGLIIAAVCCCGITKFNKLTYSKDQWAQFDSEGKKNENMFNQLFGQTHRIEMVIVKVPNPISNSSNNLLNGTVFDKAVFLQLFDLVEAIQNLSVPTPESSGLEVKLEDICFRPMGNMSDCATLSPTNYFQNEKLKFLFAEIVDDFDFEEKDPAWSHVENCIREPLLQNTEIGISCFGSFGGPIEPHMVFGGPQFVSSDTIMITIPVNNNAERELAMVWEKGFIDMMKSYSIENAEITFMAESSISNELFIEAENDKWVSIMACSFVLCWVLTILGNYYWPEKSFFSTFVHQKFTVAIVSVLLSVISSWCSIGVFSFFDVHATDNAIVVLFFIVYSIGINRCFITIRNFQSNGKHFGSSEITDEEISNRVVDVMSRSIPIVAASSLICSLCFILTGGAPFIGVKMPVIEIFSRHAGLAIFFDTCFYLLIMLPLFQYDATKELKGQVGSFYELAGETKDNMSNVGSSYGLDSPITYFQKYFAVLLMKKPIRWITCFFFLISLSGSIYFSSKLTYGFDQTMAFSKTSYLTSHFRKMNEALNVGPPVYFVVVGDLDWSRWKVQDKFCSLPGCDANSLGNTLRSLTSDKNSNGTSYLTGDVFNWVDSYLQFLDPRGPCCMKKQDGQTCLIDNTTSECVSCVGGGRKSGYKRASKNQFYKYFDQFLETKPGKKCAHGGRATAKYAISLDENRKIQGSHFMTFFKKLNLSSSIDLYTAMSFARFVAAEITANIGIEGVSVFAYSTFFPYYEQYSSMGQTLYTLVTLVLLVVFVTIVLFLHVDLRGALVTVLVLLSAFFHLTSWMYLWGIEMNVLSATNMAMSLGITVEFVIPVLHGFYNSSKLDSAERALSAIVKNGSTIISGILPSILLTAAALSLADSQILQTYFCHQLFGIAFVSTVHGVIFLPAILAFVGKSDYARIDQEDITTSSQIDSSETETASQ